MGLQFIIQNNTSVRDIFLHDTGTTNILRRWGRDYCCVSIFF